MKKVKEINNVMSSFVKEDHLYISKLKLSVEEAQKAMRRLDTVISEKIKTGSRVQSARSNNNRRSIKFE